MKDSPTMRKTNSRAMSQTGYSQVSIDIDTPLSASASPSSPIPSISNTQPSTLKRLIFTIIACIILLFLIVDTPIQKITTSIDKQSSLNTLIDLKQCNPLPGKPLVQYAIMLDAGSSGSRIHIYKFNYCNRSTSPILQSEIFKQISPGLSSYSNDPTLASESLRPLLEAAIKEIPPKLRGCTPTALKATAGLRILGKDTADRILKFVRVLIVGYGFQVYAHEGVSVMEGVDEGVFAWITVNYLLNKIGQSKKLVTAGIMDLGGGSTQIVFEPTKGTLDTIINDSKYILEYGGFTYDIYQHSYLGYGLNAAKSTIQESIIKSNTRFTPCLNNQQNQIFNLNSVEYILKGALNESIDSCSTLIKSKLFSKSNCEMKECSFDNVYQPVMGNVFTEEDFYAFSFFYDRIYSLDQKSNFTVKRTRELADLVCKQKLDGFSFDTMEEVGNNLDWCIDLELIHALLSYGYGLPDDRQLLLAKKINGFETGWCLGATLQMLDDSNTVLCLA